jgi:methionyl-tRNA formyltransferase
MSERYLVCGCTSWARRVFDTTLSKLPGEWVYADSPMALAGLLPDTAPSSSYAPPPRYLFFLHWRWKVPKEITDKYECIGFHLADLPHGRGGTPLQWAILEGGNPRLGDQEWLKAFRLTDEMDAGPIYAKRLVGFGGTAEAIYARMMDEAAAMINEIVERRIKPHPQTQEPGGMLQGPSVRPRRTPEESRLPTGPVSLSRIYDLIRCVDAEGYPYAFLDYGGLRFTFRRAVEYDGRIEADVTITEVTS